MNKMIWDIPTRIIHWLIAVPVLVNFFLEGGDPPHKVIGYISCGALVLRMVWGLTSKGHARFSAFPMSLKETKNYLSSLLTGTSTSYEGHNPIASWVYAFIWFDVMLLGISGYMMGTDAFWGEEWLEETHEALAQGMQFLVLLHFAGIIFDSIKNKRKTWLGMINGKRS